MRVESPPINAAISESPAFWKPRMSGDMYPELIANRAPPSAATAPERTKATRRGRKVLYPENRMRSSFSRMPSSVVPKRERPTSQSRMAQTTRETQAKGQNRPGFITSAWFSPRKVASLS